MRRRPELETEPDNFLERDARPAEGDGRYDEAEIFGNVMTTLLAGEDMTSHTLA
jgi:cytochrome P450